MTQKPLDRASRMCGEIESLTPEEEKERMNDLLEYIPTFKEEESK
jgi:hypothetical protein